MSAAKESQEIFSPLERAPAFASSMNQPVQNPDSGSPSPLQRIEVDGHGLYSYPQPQLGLTNPSHVASTASDTTSEDTLQAQLATAQSSQPMLPATTSTATNHVDFTSNSNVALMHNQHFTIANYTNANTTGSHPSLASNTSGITISGNQGLTMSHNGSVNITNNHTTYHYGTTAPSSRLTASVITIPDNVNRYAGLSYHVVPLPAAFSDGVHPRFRTGYSWESVPHYTLIRLYEMWCDSRRLPRSNIMFASLPNNYESFRKVRTSENKLGSTDRYTYGHPSGKRFDSIPKLFAHFEHMMINNSATGCTCVLCQPTRRW